MKKLIIIFSILFLNTTFVYAAGAMKASEGYVNVKKATIRKNPSKKSKVIDYLVVDKKISIVRKKGQWYKIKYEKMVKVKNKDKKDKKKKKEKKEKSGWISASLIRLVEKSEIVVEFNNINDKFKKYFGDNLLFLDSQLKGYDVKKMKLVISYSDENNSALLTMILPFDKKYYDEKKTKEMTSSFIDFMVYNDYLWGLVKYKTHVAESIERESMDDYQAIMSFRANILLLKENGDGVILSGKFSGDYVIFNPYVDVEFNDYKPFRVHTPDKESVEDKSVFYLPKAKGSDGKLKSATHLYNFFDLEY
ncbi:SH3 domain-containing protein [Thermodesulfobacteriota bacterium]